MMAGSEGCPSLTGKQARYLRGLGHHLRSSVEVGREGVTEAVVQAVDAALAGAELIKVKVGQGCPDHRKSVASELGVRTDAAVAQVLGRTILLYRPAEKPRLQIGADRVTSP